MGSKLPRPRYCFEFQMSSAKRCPNLRKIHLQFKYVQAIRYATELDLHIELQTTKNGRIFPPYVSVRYATIPGEQLTVEAGAIVQVNVVLVAIFENRFAGGRTKVGDE